MNGIESRLSKAKQSKATQRKASRAKQSNSPTRQKNKSSCYGADAERRRKMGIMKNPCKPNSPSQNAKIENEMPMPMNLTPPSLANIQIRAVGSYPSRGFCCFFEPSQVCLLYTVREMTAATPLLILLQHTKTEKGRDGRKVG